MLVVLSWLCVYANANVNVSMTASSELKEDYFYLTPESNR